MRKAWIKYLSQALAVFLVLVGVNYMTFAFVSEEDNIMAWSETAKIVFGVIVFWVAVMTPIITTSIRMFLYKQDND